MAKFVSFFQILAFCLIILATNIQILVRGADDDASPCDDPDVSDSEEIKCEKPYQCYDDIVCLSEGLLMNCGDYKSCAGAYIVVDEAVEDFLLEITGTKAGKNMMVEIECSSGDYLKGVKCGDYQSCALSTIMVTGNCDLEKVECDGSYSCAGATFYFLDGAEVDKEFKCGGFRSCYGCTYTTDGTNFYSCSRY